MCGCPLPEHVRLRLQDGVKLAQAVQGAGGAAASPAILAEALRGFESERTARATPVTVKSRFMGALLQIRNPWVGLLQPIPSAAYPLHEDHYMSIACAYAGSMCLACWQG